MKSTQDWHEFVETDLETHPRDGVPIEAEYENGARAQASYSQGCISLHSVSTETVGGRDALMKRWRYLRLP
jgi:hypothetical protein